ncbi:MAG: SPOR domain-containing protein [Gammaproteobacteria bacterium]
MRNLLLTLVLANLLLLAWQSWVAPAPPPPAGEAAGGLELFSTPLTPARSTRPVPPGAAQVGVAQIPDGGCLRLGPLPDAAAAQEMAGQLAGRGFDAAVIGRDTQVWLGHWVQIGGFASAGDAEASRQRLAAGGVPDAYLMQDGSRPMISLGVFRDRDRADRVAASARSMGFVVTTRDRYRPTVEQWLRIQLVPGQTLDPSILRRADDRNILRIESAACGDRGPAPAAKTL